MTAIRWQPIADAPEHVRAMTALLIPPRPGEYVNKAFLVVEDGVYSFWIAKFGNTSGSEVKDVYGPLPPGLEGG